jgi:hypothetical protein
MNVILEESFSLKTIDLNFKKIPPE